MRDGPPTVECHIGATNPCWPAATNAEAKSKDRSPRRGPPIPIGRTGLATITAMSITFNAVRSVPKAVKARVRLVTSETVEAGIAGVPDGQLDSAGFAGKAGEKHVYPDGKRTEVLVGVGAADTVDTHAIRAAAATVGRNFGRYGRIGVELPDTDLDAHAARQALVEGIALATYTFTVYKSDAKTTKLKTVDVAGGSGAKNQAALDRGAVLARGQMLARDFVNEPGGELTPPVFARRASAMAKEQGLTVKVWDEAAIKKGKLGGLLGVNRGSTLPPRLVELTYTPKGKAGANPPAQLLSTAAIKPARVIKRNQNTKCLSNHENHCKML